ncbi:HERC1 [Symbiodinium sp. CCMP2592]|nr:HERC1 [Symbiodinium sp. CCMP2592]
MVNYKVSYPETIFQLSGVPFRSSNHSSGLRLQAETAARASEVERLEGTLRGQRSEIDAQIVSLQSANLERQDSVKELGPAMKALVAEERDAAQKQHSQLLDRITQLTTRVDAEIVERRQTDERTGGKLETLQEALGREQRAREAAMSENGRAVGTLATRLDGQEKALPELDAAIRAEVSKLEDSMASFRQEERSAREVATADLSGAQARKHEAMTEEIRREHAAHKEETKKLQGGRKVTHYSFSTSTCSPDGTTVDLSGKPEVGLDDGRTFDELNRRCQEVSTLSAQQMRAELAVEVKRLDQALPGLEEKFKVLLAQERCHHEHQAQVAAQEVKAALEAHGELAEALESEQRLVVQRLTEGAAVCWGDPEFGPDQKKARSQLVDGIVHICPSAAAFAALKNTGSMAALKEDGTVVCWGNPQSGGNAAAVAGLRAVKELCATRAAFAALKEDGSVHAWGDEKHGADTTATESILSSGVTKLFGNNVSFAAIKSNGGIVSWGDPARGPPLVHPRVPDVKGIYGTKFAFAMLCQDGDVITWGDPSCGGDSSAIDAQLKEIAKAV